jgi:hypothetical protein
MLFTLGGSMFNFKPMIDLSRFACAVQHMPVRAIALSVALLLVGCSLSTDDASVELSTTTTESKVEGVVERRRAEIVAALRAALRCRNTECTQLEFLRRHTKAVLAAVVPLDDELRGTPESKAELERVATATASLRHSATEVQSCLELSAGRHAGAAFVSDCYGPAGRFREDLEYTLNALTP